MNKIKEFYNECRKNLQPQLQCKSIMAVPRLIKVVVNMGVGTNEKEIEAAVVAMTAITGQKPIVTKVKKSNAGFKIREGAPIGCMVTLRKDRMQNFLFQLVNIVFPRESQFSGLNADSFDGQGNYNLGFSELTSFPQISYGQAGSTKGMNITIVTSAEKDEQAYVLLTALGFPFKKKQQQN
jgi:large subunit ribosomal protein L5